MRNRTAAIALGKALFWDMQVGSDGVQACASCHFRAGADPRSINQLNPGGANNSDTTIDLGVNYQLRRQDFPLHMLADDTNRQSHVIHDIDDVVSSQGVKLSRFLSVEPGAVKDRTEPVHDPVFNLRGLNTRRSEPRNTPTVFNAAFNRRQFWDVRAKNLFNGVNPFGAGDANALVLKANGPNHIDQVKIRIDNGGLASQAVGPPLSDRERMFNGNCEVVAYAKGVYNLGVRKTEEDLGIRNTDPFGNPNSWIGILTTAPDQIPSQELLTIPIPNIANPPIQIGDRILTEGAFKVPSLRNVKLTAPYFHNGGQATVRHVVEFYNRGGDFREHNSSNIDFEIGKLNLTNAQIDDLVAFLTDALTDERVEQQKAPFDHPQIFVPNGHSIVLGQPVPDEDGAKDELLEIPEVGRNGGTLPPGFLQ